MPKINSFLIDFKHKNPHLLDLMEAADYTKLSKSYLYKLVTRKEIPHVRAGYRIMFDKKELDNWIKGKIVLVD